MASAQEAVEKVFREEHGLVVASLIRFFGDFDLAEEAIHDAFVVALEPSIGYPPEAVTTAAAGY